ncbi:MAG: NAD-dependent epimerase/dehydratase family protein [Chthoniobacteraceae bacterium]
MPRVVIAGCGFVGLATARIFHSAGWEVRGLTHSPESAAALNDERFPMAACDISNADAVHAIAAGQGGAPDVVIHCASSGRGGAESYRSVYFKGALNLLDAFAPRRLIFTSSTSVYAQVDGAVVTEDSAAEPPGETGHILRGTEELVLARGGIVARLAGIYGPGRSVLLRKFFSGDAVIEGDGGRIVNQVHRDDIASALLALAMRDVSGIFNVSDDAPMPQRENYAWLAQRFSLPLPPLGPIDPNRKRGWTSKRVSNAKLRALGWAPQFPSFFAAVERQPELVTFAR